MKLIAKYNRYLFPVLAVLFIISTISSYYLIKKVLQNELDEILNRTRGRIENYVSVNQSIPVISSFGDQKVIFEKISVVPNDTGFRSATQFIPEQKKEHLSRSLVFKLGVHDQLYKVTISEPLEGTRHLTILIAKIAIVTIFLMLILLVLINRKVLSKIWQPFYLSLSTIKSFNINMQEKLKFPLTSINEFNLMNSHFGMAAENAVRDFRSLKEFSENASHEIQTPLAIIRSKLDLLVQEDDLSEKQSDLVQSAYLAVSKLSRVQQSLLLLTKIDNRQFKENTEIMMEKEVNNKIDQFRDLWHSKGISYSEEIRETTITCNKELLDILLNNLFSNAVRHNIIGGSIQIKLENKTLEINNTGIEQPLIAENIFKRFYKALPTGESNGLGLSIIKEICDVSAIKINYLFNQRQHIFRLTW